MSSPGRTGEGRYPGTEGEIHYRWWSAAEPRWVVLLAHGFGDHTGGWGRYAQRLVAAGGAVVACDHRGHGLSDGPRAVIEDFDVAAREYLGVLEVAPVGGEVPLVLAGHSMGGLIAARAATLGLVPARGLALSATQLGPWPTAEKVLAAATQSDPVPDEARGHVLLDPDATFDPAILSRDLTFVEGFAGDELRYVGVFPVQTLRAWLALQNRWAEVVLDLPTLYLHGSADSLLSFRGSVVTVARMVTEDLEVRIFAGARHSIYNEANRDEVFDVLTRFIARVTSD